MLYFSLFSGLMMVLGGLLAVFLFDLLVRAIIVAKLPLIPDSDVTKAWVDPPVKPLLKIYYFNMTNPQAYLSGSTPVVEEVGPFTYQEKWGREQVEWSEDSNQVSFRMRKTYFYRPDLSSGSLEDKITLPNVPMFAMLNKMRNNGPEFLSGANIFLASQEPPQEVFETRTVEEVTWGYKHHLVDLANLILPPEEKLPELYGYFYGNHSTSLLMCVSYYVIL
jgi:scavenger receptor class B protein 1